MVELDTQVSDIRAAASVLLERIQFMRQAGISFGGDRDLYETLGYDRQITNGQYRQRYQRGGIAKRIVEAMPNATWRGGVELIEDEDPKVSTQFEQTWVELEKKFRITSVLRRADILSGLSTFSVILIGAVGKLDDELPRGNPGSLLYLTPFSGGGGTTGFTTKTLMQGVDADCSVSSLVTDVTSPRFGLPLTYQIRRTDVSSPELLVPVHWSRIIHIAEGCLDDDIFGQPSLEAVWNLLDDLDKVTGGGSEAFWLRAHQGLNINIDKDMKLSDTALDSLAAEVDEYKHNMSRVLKTKGVDVRTLGSDVANFASPADAILTQIAGTKGIPKRVLTGSEMGELASSQDRENWRDQVNGRQTQYAGPYILERLADRLIAYGYLPTPKVYNIRWSHIEVMTEKEKADGIASWASTNANAKSPIFTGAEMRDKWYGWEPLTTEQLEEEAAAAQITAPAAAPPQPLPTEELGLDVEELPRAAELMRVLEDAIVANNTAVIDAIIGVRHDA